MKKILLATVFGLTAFSAQAQEKVADSRSTTPMADMTNPFYITERGFMLDSRIGYGREKLNASINAPVRQTGYPFLTNAHSLKASETLTYGITGTWAVYGSLGYDWTKKYGASSFNEWDWTIGTKINTIEDVWRVQIGADVTWSDYSKWKKVKNEDRKDTHLYLMAGTETGENVFGYTRLDYHTVDFGSDRQFDSYDITGALHITPSGTTTADVGLRFGWDTLKGARSRDLTFLLGGYLSVYKNMALGLNADYVLASSNNIKGYGSPDNQGAYSLEFNVKYEF